MPKELNPLMYCIYQLSETVNKDFYLNAIKTLVEAKADLDITDNDGNSPLGVACSHGHIDLIKILAEANANISYINGHGESILLLACKGACDINGIKYITDELKKANLSIE